VRFFPPFLSPKVCYATYLFVILLMVPCPHRVELELDIHLHRTPDNSLPCSKTALFFLFPLNSRVRFLPGCCFPISFFAFFFVLVADSCLFHFPFDLHHLANFRPFFFLSPKFQAPVDDTRTWSLDFFLPPSPLPPPPKAVGPLFGSF